MSTPMRRIRSPCCARAASGHAAAAPPSSVMNARRFTPIDRVPPATLQDIELARVSQELFAGGLQSFPPILVRLGGTADVGEIIWTTLSRVSICMA